MTILAGSESVRNVITTLEKPEKYVLGIFRNMDALRKEQIASTVSIGITGRGIAPNYRLDASEEADHVKMVERYEYPSIPFRGQTHQPLTFDFIDNGHWSSAVMTFEEVKNLLGDLRGYQKPR
ncbi:MAG: hypothetical protein JWR80_2454 [Bradyrhizobium sp.]|nr:hypothetical protein [Bradyrhizobium sp.]